MALTANRRIYEISRTESERAGMGTTLTAAYLGENDLAIAHVGDSRAYLFRGGELTRLTQDHSLMAELIRRGSSPRRRRRIIRSARSSRARWDPSPRSPSTRGRIRSGRATSSCSAATA